MRHTCQKRSPKWTAKDPRPQTIPIVSTDSKYSLQEAFFVREGLLGEISLIKQKTGKKQWTNHEPLEPPPHLSETADQHLLDFNFA